MASWQKDELGALRELGEPPYPHAPLASRKATDTRLFLATGKPTLNADERHLLQEAARIAKAVDYARAELLDAIDADDPVLCVSACRRFLAIGGLLGDKARFAS